MKPDDDTSIVHLIRADAWMTAVLEDTTRQFTVINKGVHEAFVLRNRFSSLLPKAVSNLQLEVLQVMETSLVINSQDYKEFSNGIGMFECVDYQFRVFNMIRRFTTIVPYAPHRVYYISLKRETFRDYVSPLLGYVKDSYIGYCTSKKNSGFLQPSLCKIPGNISRQLNTISNVIP